MPIVRTAQEGFLDAIIESPEDDAPRLILADWLEERGEQGDMERAEFIRLQCKLAEPAECEWEAQDGAPCPQYNAKTRPWRVNVWCPTCAKRERMQAREKELLGSPYGVSGVLVVRQPRPEWAGGVRDILPWDRDSWVFRRGFVEETELRIDEWTAFGRELRAAAPLRIVRLTCEPATLANSVNQSFAWAMHNALVRLAQDNEPGDNPACGLDTLDLSRLTMDHWDLNNALQHAFRPWRGLRRLILPNWARLEERYRPYEIEQWKKRVPTLQDVQFK